jgi:hypothetical protein
MGEEEMMAAEAAADDMRAESELASEDPTQEMGEISLDEVVGKPSKMLIVVTGKSSRTVYGNAAEAARQLGINPTTVRQRCSGNKSDKDGNVWGYKENLG